MTLAQLRLDFSLTTLVSPLAQQELLSLTTSVQQSYENDSPYSLFLIIFLMNYFDVLSYDQIFLCFLNTF